MNAVKWLQYRSAREVRLIADHTSSCGTMYACIPDATMHADIASNAAQIIFIVDELDIARIYTDSALC